MFLKVVWSFAQTHWFIAIILGLFSIGVLSTLAQEIIEYLGFHLWYLIVVAGAAGMAFWIGLPLYFWPFLLGMTTAFAEIINKFDDEPMKALKTLPALLYHILNGMIAVFALYLLALVASKPANLRDLSDLDKLKYAMAAGFGAMLIMRSKLFNIKVGDDNVSFGPDQIIATLFRFMESAIGRTRARARRKFIEDKLDNIKFDAVYARSVMTLKRASHSISDVEMKKCCDDLSAVKTSLDSLDPTKKTDAEIQLRSYELGYVIYDKMGEDFVSDLFTKPRPDWLIRAVDPDSGPVTNTGPGLLPIWKKVEADNVFIRMMPFVATKEETVPYMAYGTNMSSNRIRQRLNWTDPAGKESLEKTKPVGCTLKDYRLAFNRRSDSNLTEGVLANLKSEQGEEVEGVLYQLPKTAVDFLEQNEPGYHAIRIKVSVKGGESDATVFVADTNQVGSEAAPTQADITSMIEGAAEHGLSEGYLKKLRSYESPPAGSTPLTQSQPAAATAVPASK